MGRISNVHDAELLFPSFQNLDFLISLYTFLEKNGLRCLEIEFYTAIIGLLLTLFHVYVLTRKPMMISSVISIMIGIGVCDAVSMVMAIGMKNMVYTFYRDICTPPLTYFMFNLFSVLGTIRDDVIRCSMWLGLLMAFVRWLVIRFASKPEFQRTSTLRFGFYATGVVLLISSVMAISNTLRTELVQIGTWAPNASCGLESDQTYVVYEYQLRPMLAANNRLLHRVFMLVFGVVSRIIPCFSLPVLTFLLIVEIRRTRKTIPNTSNLFRQRTERTTTLVIAMAVTFFIASLPSGISTWFKVIYTDEGFMYLSSLVDHFCKAILTLNASIHCFICFAMSTDYRKTVMEIWRIRSKNTRSINSVF